MDQPLSTEFLFSDEDVKKVIAALDEGGATDVKKIQQRGAFGIDDLIMAVVAVELLVNIIIKLVALWKCGIIVDARGPRVLTKKDCDLPRGTILIFEKNGTQHKLHQPSEFDIAALLKGGSKAS